MQQGLIGKQFGNYRLINSIGRGGFAEVYLGQHIYLNTKAAIKILHTQIGEQDQQAFLTEARTIANLVHPNIIRVLEFGLEQQTPYLVMDYSEGGTLRQRYPRTSHGGTHIPLIECVTLVRQVAAGLQYAHKQRIIHRDIKPENMLIDRNEEIQLSDFGIAIVKYTSRYHSQSASDVGGTVAYMAPEQLLGKPSVLSDQYALAVVVYEWLSGNLPFNGSFAEIGSQHLFSAPPPLLPDVPGLPLAVEQVIMTALAKEPAQRFPSVQAFATALEQAAIDQEFVSTYRKGSATSPMSSDNTTIGGLSAQETLSPIVPSETPLLTATELAVPYRKQPAPVNTSPTQYSPFNTPPQFSGGNFFPTQATRQASKQRRTTYIVMSAALIVLLLAIIVGTGAYRLSTNTATNTSSKSSVTTPQNGSGTAASPTASSMTPTATPSPTAVVAGTVVYQANWSKDIGNWHGSPEWKSFQNGQVGSDGSAQSSFILWAPAQMPSTNYAVEARIQYVRASYPSGGGASTLSVNNYEYGIVIRGDGGGNGYEVGMSEMQDASLIGGMYGHKSGALVNIVQNDNASNDSFENGLTPPQGVLASKDSQIDNNWHVYRVEVSGNSIKFFLDGALLVSTTDNIYSNGVNVGLRAVYATTNVSSFKVIAL